MTDTPPSDPPAASAREPALGWLERASAMLKYSPQAQALGIELVRVEPAKAWGRVPYRLELVGDAARGVVAGGVVTTFLDQLSGIAAVTALTEPTSVATIDLRIDYMRGAEPNKDLLAQAHCYKVTRHVAFVRAVAYDENPDDPVAHAVATFMVNSSAGRRPGANLRTTP